MSTIAFRETCRLRLKECRDALGKDDPLTTAHRRFLECAAGRRGNTTISTDARALLRQIGGGLPAGAPQTQGARS